MPLSLENGKKVATRSFGTLQQTQPLQAKLIITFEKT